VCGVGSWWRLRCGLWCSGWGCSGRGVDDVPAGGLVEYVGRLGLVGGHGHGLAAAFSVCATRPGSACCKSTPGLASPCPGLVILLCGWPHKTLCDRPRCYFSACVRQIVDEQEPLESYVTGTYGRGFLAYMS
jgi:hypothetical protein